ncbi:hypothetical protein [uncultured Draconibacterium sp.]|uniref:hypothetical protein n=1 Tax=uncultured Draconibacterium sp. TaxID=1573823 RepID=UPI0029C61E15|nr:hypothetical protein [uncultured Draconibacterium sp.]
MIQKSLILVFLIVMACSGILQAQNTFRVTVDEVKNGKIKIEPAIPDNGQVSEGTVLTISAKPDKNFALDAVYYSVKGMWGDM